ncbi:hypothetical protein [Nocardioides sp.]|uniref:hypothetical protein n=1 Tax=Nocardioides sp. TaxID=35761 RepID=UPI0026270292|nr:hypothetical protein [Nocardioides sp.]
MYGDPDVLRSQVDDLREQALDVRSLADQLVARTEGLGWSGRAAEAMRLRVTERAGHLRAAAAEHDAAADALLAHAQEVARLQEAIQDVEQRVHDLVAEAGTRQSRRDLDPQAPGGAASSDPTADDDRLVLAFEAPPPGHRDWLSAEVPGL